jgi:hypothetical protein
MIAISLRVTSPTSLITRLNLVILEVGEDFLDDGDSVQFFLAFLKYSLTLMSLQHNSQTQ